MIPHETPQLNAQTITRAARRSATGWAPARSGPTCTTKSDFGSRESIPNETPQLQPPREPTSDPNCATFVCSIRSRKVNAFHPGQTKRLWYASFGAQREFTGSHPAHGRSSPSAARQRPNPSLTCSRSCGSMSTMTTGDPIIDIIIYAISVIAGLLLPSPIGKRKKKGGR